MKYLLDTNHLIHVRNGTVRVIEKLDEVSAEAEVITSVLVAAELVYGAECSSRRDENMRLFNEQLAMLDGIEPVSESVGRRFGALKAQLRRRGRIRQDIDLLIAATAIELDAVLVTDDGGLLDGEIEGLTAENWCPGERPRVAACYSRSA